MITMNVCRICLAQGPDKDIKQLKLPKKETHKSYIEILLFCLDIQVAEDSKVTSKVCTKCYNKIIAYHKFKSLALKNDSYLRSLETNIKEEEIDAEDDKIEGKISYTFEEDTLCEDIKQEGSLDESTQMKGDSHDETTEVKDLQDDSAHLQDSESDDERLSDIKMKNENNLENSETETATTAINKSKEKIDEASKENGPNKVLKRKKHGIKFTITKRKGPVALKKLEFCEQCGKATANLTEHSKIHMREKRKELQCDLCNKKFASVYSYKKHNLYIHMGYRNKCNICGKAVRSLNSHMKTVHQQDKLRHECQVCHKRFLTAAYVKKHMSTHSEVKPYACDLCDQRFTHSFCVDNHKKTVHELQKPHLCQYCSMSFFKKHSLMVHMRKHTKEKPYSCSECGKCFSSTNGLKSHRLTHSDVKGYECRLCDYKCTRLNYLRKHMLTHTKEKKHPCKYCGVCFRRSDHRKRHEFTAHEKDLVQVP